MIALCLCLPALSTIGDSTPGGGNDAYLLEDDASGYLLEDGTSYYLMESAV